MRRTLLLSVAVVAALLWPAGAGAAEAGAGHGLDPAVLAGLALIFVVAKLGGELFERLGQPAVLGELVAGIALGNLALVGLGGVAFLRDHAVVVALAEIGVIVLLFEVGLESNLSEMLEVGWASLLVAALGVVVPLLLGWAVAAYFIPDAPTLAHLFIGATLCATSVGITARVLKDLGKVQTRESRIVLGAAVIDDVLGLLVLAVVAGAIRAAATGATLSTTGVLIIALKSLLFLFGALLAGRYLAPHVFRGGGRMATRGVLLCLALAFCFALAWLAALVGLAPIIGAFAAGLVLDEVHFEPFTRRGEQDLHDLLAPVGAVLVPVFFVLMGMRVDVQAVAQPRLLWFASALTLAAIVGKQVCSLGVLGRGVNRLAVGVGMIPRGEVGLIFAGIGAALALPDARGVATPVIDAATFGAVVIMVVVTTLVTPPALKWALARGAHTPEPLPEALRETAEESAERHQG
jgi:Kef-type K+ transport system membrane component KefB